MSRRFVMIAVVSLVGLGMVPSGVSTASPTGDSTGRVWLSVSSGSAHTCAIQRDHTLWCWGLNLAGELGTGDTLERRLPVRTGAEADWVQVASGAGHSCGVRINHTLWCWGSNQFGQLGLGRRAPQDRLIPTRVGSDKDWASVVAGYAYTCGLRLDDTLWCWGYNKHHQLGLGDMARELWPTQVSPGSTWTQASVGDFNRRDHTCTVQTDGTLWCWGVNKFGQLGQGDTDDRTLPTQVGTAVDWAQVDVGFAHTCATRTDHTLWCWGANYWGQLGLGDEATRLVPTQV
jgi:alpha-tubulin suppressor-like RCC1 family protein